jgi:hypothetical protein
MNYDALFYFYSTVAQTLSALLGFLGAIVLYRYQKLESEGRERKPTTKKMLRIFRSCLITNLLTILFSMYMITSVKQNSDSFNTYACALVITITAWNLTSYYRVTEMIFLSSDIFMNKLLDETPEKGPSDIEERK